MAAGLLLALTIMWLSASSCVSVCRVLDVRSANRMTDWPCLAHLRRLRLLSCSNTCNSGPLLSEDQRKLFTEAPTPALYCQFPARNRFANPSAKQHLQHAVLTRVARPGAPPYAQVSSSLIPWNHHPGMFESHCSMCAADSFNLAFLSCSAGSIHCCLLTSSSCIQSVNLDAWTFVAWPFAVEFVYDSTLPASGWGVLVRVIECELQASQTTRAIGG